MTDNDKIELINAMVALRRYHDTVLLKELGRERRSKDGERRGRPPSRPCAQRCEPRN
jgi:hypothetical protein